MEDLDGTNRTLLDEISNLKQKINALEQRESERLRAEEALRASESLYRNVFENHTAIKLLIDPDSGRILEANKAAAEYYGWPKEKLCGMTIKDINTASEEAIQDAIAKARTLQQTYFESRHMRADGSKRDVAIYTNNISTNGNDVLHSVIHDITDHKKTETMYENDRKFLRQVIDTLPVFVCVKTEDGRFALANKCLADAYGSTVPGVEGKRDSDFSPTSKEVAHFLQDDLDVIRNKKTKKIEEEEITYADGTVHYLSTIKVPLVQPDGRCDKLLCICMDITEQKRAEMERRQAEELILLSEERFSKAFRSSPAPLVISEIETGTLIDVNDAWAQMMESTREEQIGRTTKDIGVFVNFSDRDRLVYMLRARGSFREEPVDFRTTTGKIGKALLSAETITLGGQRVMLSLVYDETKRRAAEEKLWRLNIAIEQSAEEIIITNPEGLIEYVNPAFEKITGYSRREAIGQTPRIVKSGVHDNAFYETLWNTIKEGNIWTGQFTNRRKDGTLIQEDATISPLVDSHGQLTGFVSLKRDITEQVKLQSQLRQAQKMEAVGTLAGGIAHDFNNILTIIMGFGTMLQTAVKQSDLARKYVDQIIATSQKAANLTKSLLAFSRKQPISLVPISINATIRGTEKLLKRLLTEDVELKVSLASDDIIILADSTQIDQILFNLATNSRDAMKTGGMLSISTMPFNMTRSFKEIHGFGNPGRYALLTVSDTGCGMSERVREKIYDPFFTTKELGKGTGLGLSTVYGIVKQHNGYIDVSSEPGKGTTFSIYFPMIEIPSEQKKMVAPDVEGGAETILVAEDDEIVRLLIKEVLTMYGYTVIEAEDGQDAVDKFNELKTTIDLIILDSVMPKKNGRETYDEVRRIDPHAKTLFISGYTKDIILDKGVEDGKVDFIMKPILPDILLAIVREILDRPKNSRDTSL